MARVLISFSGHKLSIEALRHYESEFDIIEEIVIPMINFDEQIEPQLEQLINQIKYNLDGSQNITIIVPGHSNLSSMLYVFIFGLIGHPPDIYLMRENEEGLYMPFKKVKGRDIKKAGRQLREYQTKNLN